MGTNILVDNNSVLDSRNPNDSTSVISRDAVTDNVLGSGGSGDSKSGKKNAFYTKEGEFLGYDDKNEDKVYISTKGNYEYSLGITGGSDNKPNYDSLRKYSTEIGISNTEFILRAATAYGESTAYKSQMTEELKYEIFAIAMVNSRNEKAYGHNNDQAILFKNTSPEKRNNTKMQYAIAGVINVLKKGEDYSNGATMWDGQEQSFYPDTEVRGWVDLKTSRGNISIELHMNTMGWDIKDEHFQKWKESVGSKFLAPKTRISPDNYSKGKTKYNNKGKIRLFSTAVYNKTIFWVEK